MLRDRILKQNIFLKLQKKIIDNIAYIYSYYSYLDFKVCQLVIIFLRTWMFYLIKTEQDRFFRYSLSHSQHYFAKNFLTRLSSMNILEICLPQVFLFLKVIGTWTQKVKTFEHNKIKLQRISVSNETLNISMHVR